MTEKNCWNCSNHLGGGCCSINSEKECGENEFELWESGRINEGGKS